MTTAEVSPLAAPEFRRFQELIYREAGIALGPTKQTLVEVRLRPRIRELGLVSYGDYHERVLRDAKELVTMLDCICTSQTQFFREPHQFHYLETVAVQEWLQSAQRGLRPQHVRAWSAGCATGEEPYSLGMSMRTALPEHWDVELFATDLSTKNLALADAGLWSISKAVEIPLAMRKRFMLRGTGAREGEMAATDALRELIRFSRVNLHAPPYAVPRGFDAIFCRNVLIYFDEDSRARALTELVSHLAPGGLLFLGHAETVHGLDLGLVPVVPTVYRRAGGHAPRRSPTEDGP